MRVLLDECVDRRLAQELHGHEVETVTGLGWAGVHNGDLLARATGRFDAFVTVDRNLASPSSCGHFFLSFLEFSSEMRLGAIVQQGSVQSIQLY